MTLRLPIPIIMTILATVAFIQALPTLQPDELGLQAKPTLQPDELGFVQARPTLQPDELGLVQARPTLQLDELELVQVRATLQPDELGLIQARTTLQPDELGLVKAVQKLCDKSVNINGSLGEFLDLASHGAISHNLKVLQKAGCVLKDHKEIVGDMDKFFVDTKDAFSNGFDKTAAFFNSAGHAVADFSKRVFQSTSSSRSAANLSKPFMPAFLFMLQILIFQGI